MRRLLVVVGVVAFAVGVSALPAWADGSRDLALTACQAHDAKKVTVTVTVDGQATKSSYRCSQLVASTTTVAKNFVPAPTDFQLAVNVTSQSCFGSAGCNIRFRVAPTYIGSQALNPSKRYTVTYAVNGGTAPQSNSFTINGTQASVQQEELVQTPSADVVVTATPTNVLVG